MTSAATALVTVALAMLLAVSAVAAPDLVVLAAALVVVVLALGWAALLTLPSPRGTTSLVLAAGAAAIATSGAIRALEPDGVEPLGALAGLLAMVVLGAFAHQMLRTDGRPRLVESATGALTGACLALLASSWVVLVGLPLGRELAATTAAAVTATALAAAIPTGARARWLVAFVTAAGAAALVASLAVVDGALRPVDGVLTGLVVAMVAISLEALLAAQVTARRWPSLLAVAAAPVAAAGVVGYVAALLVPG